MKEHEPPAGQGHQVAVPKVLERALDETEAQNPRPRHPLREDDGRNRLEQTSSRTPSPKLRLESSPFSACSRFSTSSSRRPSRWRTSANDCKIFGLPLRQITRRFPRIDFCFRSHSSASPLPHCVEGWEERFPRHRPPASHAEEFARFALGVGARHAVPFASNHCFLHDETLAFNRLATSPDLVARTFERLAAEAGSAARCVVMPPGSSWSSAGGFALVPSDEARRDEEIAALRSRAEPLLRRQADLECRAVADLPAFRRYFGALVASLPPLLPRRFLPRVGFEAVESGGSRWLVVDLATGEIGEVPSRRDAGDVAVEIRTAALILNDCTRKRMFSAWTPGKRLRIRVNGDSLRPASAFFALLDMAESGMLPLRRNLAPRSLAARLRRWREPAELARLAVRHAVMRRPFSPAHLHPPAAR